MKGQSPSRRFIRMALLSLIFLTAIPVRAATESQEKPKDYDSPLNYGIDVKFQPSKFSNLTWGNSSKSSSSGYGALASIEWLPLGPYYGKLAVGLTFGYSRINNAGLSGGLTGTMYAIPLGAYLAYRLDLMKNQLIVPFAKYGPSMAYVYQNPSADASKNSGYYYSLDWTLGAELCLNALEPSAGRTFDREMGINGTYFVFEVTWSQNLNDSRHPDLSGSQILAGMRFEF
jgi:hypothetical protein